MAKNLAVTHKKTDANEVSESKLSTFTEVKQESSAAPLPFRLQEKVI